MSWIFVGSLETKMQKSQNSDTIRRFWIGAGDTKQIIVLDDIKSKDNLVGIFEHNPIVNDTFYWYFTCTTDNNCYLCKQGNRPIATYYLTVLELWQDRKIKVLYPIRRASDGSYPIWRKLERLMLKHSLSSLQLAKISVTRDSKQESSVGGIFEYLGQYTPIVGEDFKPFNYEEVLAPKSEEYFKQLEEKAVVVYQKSKAKSNAVHKEKLDDAQFKGVEY